MKIQVTVKISAKKFKLSTQGIAFERRRN